MHVSRNSVFLPPFPRRVCSSPSFSPAAMRLPPFFFSFPLFSHGAILKIASRLPARQSRASRQTNPLPLLFFPLFNKQQHPGDAAKISPPSSLFFFLRPPRNERTGAHPTGPPIFPLSPFLFARAGFSFQLLSSKGIDPANSAAFLFFSPPSAP